MISTPDDDSLAIDRRLRALIFILRPSLARRAGASTDRVDDLTENGRLAWRVVLAQIIEESAGPTAVWAAAALEIERRTAHDERGALASLSTDLATFRQLTPDQDRAWGRNLLVVRKLLARSALPMWAESATLLPSLVDACRADAPLVAEHLARLVQHAGTHGVREGEAPRIPDVDDTALGRIVAGNRRP
jgi:hypothetical protein